MKTIVKKLAILMVPVVLYVGFFAFFEPNNYFGLKQAAAGTAPIGRIQAYRQAPGNHIILGDSRLAHFDMAIANGTGRVDQWQNLSFGGASLRETLDLAEYCLQLQPGVQNMVMGLSFYTLNASYDTDRMSALEQTLTNPLAYLFNLEYNVNALTGFTNFLAWAKTKDQTGITWAQAQEETETADWGEDDYLLPDGTRSPWHNKLTEYTRTIAPVIENWAVNQEQFQRLLAFMQQCQSRGICLSIVLPPMHESVTDLCRAYQIDAGMQPVLQMLAQTADGCPLVTVYDYEWNTTGHALDLAEWQYFDGFHLDTEKGLPLFTADLFGRL